MTNALSQSKRIQRTIDIELGLTALCLLADPGVRLTRHDIAEVCGCSIAAIWRIEQKALKNLRRRLNPEDYLDFLEPDRFADQDCSVGLPGLFEPEGGFYDNEL